MHLSYEYPCHRARERSFPLSAGYLLYAPEDNSGLARLLSLAEHLLSIRGSLKLVSLRQYDGEQSVTDFSPRSAQELMEQGTAEAFAVFPALSTELALEALRNREFADEAALVRACGQDAVAFFHEGHASLEFVGNPALLREIALQLLAGSVREIEKDRN